MNKLSLLNVSVILSSPTVIRLIVITLGVVICTLAGPAAAHACGLSGGGCGS